MQPLHQSLRGAVRDRTTSCLSRYVVWAAYLEVLSMNASVVVEARRPKRKGAPGWLECALHVCLACG